MRDFIDSLNLGLDFKITGVDKYTAKIDSSNKFATAFTILSKNKLIDLNNEMSYEDMFTDILKWTSNDYIITLSAKFVDDEYSCTVERIYNGKETN